MPHIIKQDNIQNQTKHCEKYMKASEGCSDDQGII